MNIRLKALDQEAYAAAAVGLDEQYKGGDPSVGEVIESLANWGVPSSLKGSLGMLARESVSRTEQPVEYRARCRALGLGAFAAIMLSEKAQGSLSFLYGRQSGGLLYDKAESRADTTLEAAEAADIVLGQMGEPAHNWIKARSSEVGLPQKEEFWFMVGASRGLDHVRFMAALYSA